MNSAFPMPTQLDIAASENMFLYFSQKGYRHLIPVVPPDARMEPYQNSRGDWVKPNLKSRGKFPGYKHVDGTWRTLTGWTKNTFRREDYLRWHKNGASVGIALADLLYVVDADVYTEEEAKIVDEMVVRHLGVLPRRVGRAPKMLYLVRSEERINKQTVRFGDNGSAVELLGNLMQFVAWGVHNVTGLPYSWPDGIPDFADVPVVPAAKLQALLDEIVAVMPKSKLEDGKEPGDDVDPALLRGDPNHVRKAVAAMANPDSAFGNRQDWLRVGYAIKAAMGPEHHDEARELFVEWSEKWDNPTKENDPDDVRANFERMHPSRIGASWLYETAEKHSGGQFRVSDIWMEGESDVQEPLFPPEPGTRDAMIAAGENPDTDVYLRRSITDLFALPDAKYLIDRHVSDQGVGILFGAPGTGKSFITLDMALSIAFGMKEWQGYPINAGKPLNVLYLAGEGARGYKARVMAWMQERGIDRAQAGAGRFDLIDAPINFMKPEDVAKLIRTIRGIDGDMGLVVVDTVSRVIPGADENLQKDMTLFVESCRQLETRFHCPVLGVHHTNKAGEIRGSSVFEGAGDFMFRLDRKKGERVGRLHCHKMKDGSEDGWDQPYRFDLVSIAETANPQGLPLTSLVIARCTPGESAELGGLTPDKATRMLQAMTEDAEAGKPWSRNARAKDRHYIQQMTKRFEMSADTAEETLNVWIGEGRVVERRINTRTKATGLFTVMDVHNEPDKPDVFN